MLQKLVSHNDDIRRLLEKGYALGFDSNYLLVRDIFYLDHELQQKTGAIVTKLNFVTNERVQQENHQVFFAGGVPYGLDGRPIPNLGGGPHQLPLSDAAKDVVVERSFSNKRKVNSRLVNYDDFFDKIESYATIINGPAKARYGADPLTFRAVDTAAPESVFKFRDTLTSLAEITDLSAKFKDEVVALIGLGGTGAYLLDYLTKTPVREIRAFDGDVYHIHNAFRSPGCLEESELGQKKADIHRNRYDNFRTGLTVVPKYIDASCGSDLDGVTFAFVCVDKGPARAEIFDLLLARRIPFIDTGLGLKRRDGDDRLTGMIRTTYYSPENGARVRQKGYAELKDQPGDLYRTAIQTAELNALNAAVAVIRYKQLRGFYVEDVPYYNLVFGVSDLDTGGAFKLDEN